MAFGTTVALCSTLLLLSTLEAASCPNGWVAFQDSCYAILRFSRDWVESQAVCQLVGGENSGLAEINSYDENVFLTSLLKDRDGGTAWIGLNDLLVENEFVWTKTLAQPEFSNWFRNEPNDAADQDCARLDHSGFWDDVGCDRRLWAICERPSIDADVIG